jgi:hypothetical protein
MRLIGVCQLLLFRSRVQGRSAAATETPTTPIPDVKIFAGSSNPPLAEAICSAIGIEPGKISITAFPDGETLAKIEENVRDRFKHLTSYGTPGSKYSSGVNSDRALYVVTGSGSSRHRFSLQRQGEPQS